MAELNECREERDRVVRELEAENTELKVKVSKLRAELDAVMHELEGITDLKLGLELEIAAYRRLLEGEETRFV